MSNLHVLKFHLVLNDQENDFDIIPVAMKIVQKTQTSSFPKLEGKELNFHLTLSGLDQIIKVEFQHQAKETALIKAIDDFLKPRTGTRCVEAVHMDDKQRCAFVTITGEDGKNKLRLT